MRNTLCGYGLKVKHTLSILLPFKKFNRLLSHKSYRNASVVENFFLWWFTFRGRPAIFRRSYVIDIGGEKLGQGKKWKAVEHRLIASWWRERTEPNKRYSRFGRSWALPDRHFPPRAERTTVFTDDLAQDKAPRKPFRQFGFRKKKQGSHHPTLSETPVYTL